MALNLPFWVVALVWPWRNPPPTPLLWFSQQLTGRVTKQSFPIKRALPKTASSKAPSPLVGMRCIFFNRRCHFHKCALRQLAAAHYAKAKSHMCCPLPGHSSETASHKLGENGSLSNNVCHWQLWWCLASAHGADTRRQHAFLKFCDSRREHQDEWKTPAPSPKGHTRALI